MRFYRNGFLTYAMAIAVALIVFNGISSAQFNVSISGPSAATMAAPTGQFNVTATVAGNTNSLTKIVFYRNDVPYKTLTGSSAAQVLTENQLGQDTYAYRARAYDSQGAWVDSSDVKLTVETPRVFKMGDSIGGNQTHGPDRAQNHTDEIQTAVNYIGGLGGGTLYFPCAIPSGDTIAAYNIKNTITVPSNVTLQGESSEAYGRCQMLWNDVSWYPGTNCPAVLNPPSPLTGKPMFKVEGDKSRVRFRDLWLYSRSSGVECYPRYDWPRIQAENTTAVLIDAQSNGQIADVILENVSIFNFTYGIKATGNSVSGIKLRGVRPDGNFRQLFIDATYAYDWDVQNFNLSSMMEQQGAVEINTSGAPSSYTGENAEIKFLQLNCNGNAARTPAFCVNVKKHGGLYFKQLHHEGTNKSIVVEDIAPLTNAAPIIFEHSVATGEFKDASMKLYLIGNGITSAPETPQVGLDAGRLRFIGAGVNATLVDCGDIHYDWTDVVGGPPAWNHYQMLYTHSERNRESFFAENGGGSFIKSHTVCPSNVAGQTNINEIGGEHFDTGILPMEAILPYSSVFSSANCGSPSDCAVALQTLLDSNSNRGSIYIAGSVTVDRTITIPSGRQLVGGPRSALVLSTAGTSLLQINVPVATNNLPRTSGITIRNLRLKTTQTNTSALAIVGANDEITPGTSSDMHFSGLTFEGFGKGLDVRRYNQATTHPMVDGLSWKNIKFVNNMTAASVLPANISNWNIMDLSMESNSTDAVGWHQSNSGNSMQNVTCQGTDSNPMKHCIKLDIAGTYLTGFKKTQNVENALTFGENGTVFDPPYRAPVFSISLLRDNDFRTKGAGAGRINIIGKTFITSFNNRYNNFNVATQTSYEGDVSRVTYCGDTFDGGVPYPGLAARHPNLYVGVPTPTRVECGTRPKPWEAVVRWGGAAGDRPLAGNFLDNVREDLVIYREGSPSYFHIKRIGGPDSLITDWGTVGDVPLIGHFFSNARAQVVVWRASTGIWWVKDPQTNAVNAWNWGISGDIPFVGNFLDESGAASGDKDEIAIYRPSSQTIWIMNPRSGQYISIARAADYGTAVQVGDFLGAGYDQIAQFKDGIWSIVNARTNLTYTVNLGAAGDVPVSGKYLPGACAQLGVWRPSSQEFIVKDPFASCGNRSQSMIWGSNNDFGTTAYADDIPLRINTADGSLHRPTAYRPTKGVFTESLANGQWWIHDPF